jgi:tetratricopeptide (TPR) repeat protein
LTYGGDAPRAIVLLENAQRLNPYHTADEQMLAWAYFFAQRYEDALKAMNKVKRHSGTFWAYKAAIHAQLGQSKEAGAAVVAAQKLNPEISLQGEYEERIAAGMVPQYAQFMTDALRKAGWPE